MQRTPASVLLAAVLAVVMLPLSVSAAEDDGVKRDSKPTQLPTQSLQTTTPLPFNIQLPPTRPKQDYQPNTVQESISQEARNNFVSSMMAVNPFSLREMIAMMAVKYKAKEGLSFDDVVDSMKVKANEINFKFVGHNPLWKDIVAITGETDTPRVEFFSFCDAIVARDILDLSLEFAIFLPCRVAIVEDAHKDIWIMTLDWDVRWLDTSQNPNKISEQLREKAIIVREAIDTIMRAGANGDF